ncbi:MAG: hypothetical protein FJ006_01940 [Chloroflexi bacterium]|nr:hypothetical protein [Chloroflexota bacterium]
MQKRITGSKKVFPDLIRAKPGRTAREYANMALDQGLCGSASKDPVFSLATTLMKEVREGRMPGVRASGRPMRFYPDSHTSKVSPPNFDKPTTILLPTDISETINILVEVGKFENRSEALIWLAREGIKAKSLELAQVKKVVEQIKQLKQSVPV